MAFTGRSKNNGGEDKQKRAFHKATQISVHLNSEKRELRPPQRPEGNQCTAKKNSLRPHLCASMIRQIPLCYLFYG